MYVYIERQRERGREREIETGMFYMHISTYNVPLTYMYVSIWGFPGCSSGKESTCRRRSCRIQRLNSWARQIPWKRARQPTLVLLLRECHGQRSLAGYSPHMGSQSVRQNWSNSACTNVCIYVNFVHKT